MQKILDALGGRKFLLTLVILALAAVIELKTERGISEQFVALLVGVLGVFSAANATITSKFIGQQQAVLPEVGSKEPEAGNIVAAMAQQVLINQREQGEVLAQVAKGVSQTNGVLAALATKR